MTRRDLLRTGTAAVAARAAAQETKGELTRFQVACMTLPYSPFPLERALQGIKGAGYQFVAWGTTHMEANGQRTPVIAVDAPASEARSLARRCRDLGLDPVMLFATVNIDAPDALKVHLRRIEQAAAAGIKFLLTFGKTTPGEYDRFVGVLKQMAPAAQANNVMVVIKQHGGNTATGKLCSKVIRDVGHGSVRMCYDAGNVLDYENQDPIPDIRECWPDVRAFAIKDHRNFPRDQDCGPGFGEIDHYKVLMPVARTGLTMPLACENIFEPIVARPRAPEGVDALARRAREYVEAVIRGIQAA